uniref:cadherin-like protein 26 n=1 Tax=Scatophagus argus TaxID=75038 RepID=UPI001ED7E8A6|nr:cadherin-like protein 26 [Scatophagus argus]
METIRLSLFVMLCVGVQRASSDFLHRQKRNWIIDSFIIDEGYSGQFPYLLGKIQIEKSLTLFKIQGEGVDKEPRDVLKIDENTGEIFVHRAVDYEKHKSLKLVFQAFDKEKNIIDTQLGIEITIADANDNIPKFDFEKREIRIEEATVQGTDLILIKASDGDASLENSELDLKIVSVTPTPHDLEFYLVQTPGTQSGIISFKGCLEYEEAKKYTIIVEAKDHGKKIQQSSSCTVIINIEDGNNHIPEITGQTGPGRVKEGEENVLIFRLQVADKDTVGTAAWRAIYHVHGDTNNNFRISTDPVTNEGLLYVEKHLDYEESPSKNVTISVENEIAYYTCKVVRKTSVGLWEVVTAGSVTTVALTGEEKTGLSVRRVTVTVEDVNEAPIFDEPNKRVTMNENIESEQYLGTFTARDPDIFSPNTFVYMTGDDPAGWVKVDPVTGKVTTIKTMDRESTFVKDSIYTVTIYAVDDGKPPQTGTATLSIHINDDNDNVPTLTTNVIDMCQSEGPSVANITVVDLDEEPYGGPFHFKLLGDVRNKWSVDPQQGYSVNLVKENSVHSGQFTLQLEVSDRQHKTAVHTVSVTVCDCLDTTAPNCRFRKVTGSAAGAGALGIIFFGMLLFAGLLLLVFLVSCKAESKEIPDESDEGQQHLINSNTEAPGTDCKVLSLYQGPSQNVKQTPPTTIIRKKSVNTTAAAAAGSQEQTTTDHVQQRRDCFGWLDGSANSTSQQYYQTKSLMRQEFTREDSTDWKYLSSQSMGASSNVRTRHQHENSAHRYLMKGSKISAEYDIDSYRQYLHEILNERLCNLKASEEEDVNYDILHVYDEERQTEFNYELDPIPISDVSFDPDLNLDFKFNTLASICMPPESTACSTRTSHVMENFVIKMESEKTSMNIQSHF